MTVIARPLHERLLDKISPEPNSGCWLFDGHVMPNGYGQIRSDGGRKGRTLLAHRVSYEMHKGPIPEGLELDHLCRNRCCVNPDHLEPVTRSVNINRGSLGSVTRARAASITHCPQGHAYSFENTYINNRGARACRACGKLRARARKTASDFIAEAV